MSGPPVPTGTGRVAGGGSRWGCRWVAAARESGARRPPPMDRRPRSTSSTPECSPACGSGRRCCATEAGTSGGRATRTPRWPAGSWSAAERLVCLPAMASEYTPRNSIESLWRQYLDYGDYRERTALRHPGRCGARICSPPLVVATAGAAVGRRAPCAGSRGRARGLRVAARGRRHPGGATRPIRGPTRCSSRWCWRSCISPMAPADARGAVRHGPPLAAIARALGRDQLADQLSRPGEPVYAPSLDAQGRADDLVNRRAQSRKRRTSASVEREDPQVQPQRPVARCSSCPTRPGRRATSGRAARGPAPSRSCRT